MSKEAAVLLYPGCIFFEVALVTETLAEHMPVRYYTPDGQVHIASNGAHIGASGDFEALSKATVVAVLVPALRAQAERGALLAGICAGSLVLASAGLLAGRRGTHNYTNEHAPPEKVAATAKFWQGMRFERANLVQDGQLITAQPWAYRQFAATVAKQLGVLQPEAAAALEAYVTRSRYGVA
jgi:transcriptional regulator GlxA family with amidase domain